MRRSLSLAVLGLTVVAVLGFTTIDIDEPPRFLERVRYPLEYEPIIRGHARNYRLDAALIAALIYQESRFRKDAESSSGAIGLMQVLPATAKGIALRTGGTAFRTEDLYNPEINIRYGSWYLRHLLDKYGDVRTALAAYNAGQANVDRWRSEGSGIAFQETREYVDRVLSLRRVYRRAHDL